MLYVSRAIKDLSKEVACSNLSNQKSRRAEGDTYKTNHNSDVVAQSSSRAVTMKKGKIDTSKILCDCGTYKLFWGLTLSSSLAFYGVLLSYQ